jgi:hypothetical protein
MKYAVIPLETERVGSAVIGASIEVHRHLGTGFLSYLKTTGLRLGYLLNFHHVLFVPFVAPILCALRGTPTPGSSLDIR